MVALVALSACRGPKTSPPALSEDAGAPVAREATPRVDAGADLTLEEICARTPSTHAATLAGKKPFVDLDPHCGDDNHFCNRVAKTPDPLMRERRFSIRRTATP